ncbi:ABC transporter permease subunit [Mesorhizobium sp. M1340]|uniref:ABC transporter permease n=1 Tax=Mesorhizobium sp. M1340 TaxID=2957087 RepID=UPI0033393D20
MAVSPWNSTPHRVRFPPIVPCLVLFVAFWLLSQSVPALARWPQEAVLPLGEWLNRVLDHLLHDVTIKGHSITDYSRDVAAVFAWPVNWLIEALTEGHFYDLPGGGEFWLAPPPWFGIAAALVLLVHALGGRGPATMAAATLAFVVLLGLWPSTVTTLIAVLFSVVVSVAGGLLLGIWAFRSSKVSSVLSPVYDALQTVPVFSYLALIIMIFGFGQVAGLIATVIFAMPPMARATELALKGVPAELRELSEIVGCSPRQKLWLVDLPARSSILLLGVNQVIMLSLAMVIIASVIGAGGLGGDVISSLRSMRLTEALLSGLAITLLAIVLDRTTRAWATRSEVRRVWGVSSWRLALIVMAASLVFGLIFPEMGLLDDHPIVNVGRQLDSALAAFNATAGPSLTALQNVFITWVLRPVREGFAAMPWAVVTLVLAAPAVLARRLRLALAITLMLAAVAALGLWDKAMISLYLVTLSIVGAFLVGLPIGIAAGLSDWVDRVATVIVDLIQTLPTFVYLIPVVALFGVGDFAAFLAILIFVIAPIVRYTAAGLRQVPVQLSEAATMVGCTPLQKLRLVLMPAALPQLILGLNQAVMLGFSMLVITALVGSRGLEEITLVAVSKVRPGDGLVAGFGIAVLAIILDRLLGLAAQEAERRFAPVQSAH